MEGSTLYEYWRIRGGSVPYLARCAFSLRSGPVLRILSGAYDGSGTDLEQGQFAIWEVGPHVWDVSQFDITSSPISSLSGSSKRWRLRGQLQCREGKWDFIFIYILDLQYLFLIVCSPGRQPEVLPRELNVSALSNPSVPDTDAQGIKSNTCCVHF